MQVTTRMDRQPAMNRRRLVRRQAVEDDVDTQTGLDARVDLAWRMSQGCGPTRPVAGFSPATRRRRHTVCEAILVDSAVAALVISRLALDRVSFE